MKISKSFFSLIFLFLTLFACQDDVQKQEKESVGIDSLAPPIIKIWSKKILKDPENASLYFSRAKTHYDLGDVQSSLDDLKKAVALDSTNPEYYNLLADIYFSSDKIFEAIKVLEKSISINHKHIPTLLNLSKYYLFTEKYNESIKLINDALRIDVFNAYAYFLKGMNYREMQDTSKAISSWQTSVEQDPTYMEPYMQLANIYAKREDKLALTYYDNVLRIDSANLNAYFGKAKFYQSANEFEQAIEVYEKLIEISPQYEDAFYELGVVYYGMDSLTKAFNNFKLATKIDPTYAEAFAGMGLCAEFSNQPEKARRYYRISLGLRSNYIIPVEGLARLKDKI